MRALKTKSTSNPADQGNDIAQLLINVNRSDLSKIKSIDAEHPQLKESKMEAELISADTGRFVQRATQRHFAQDKADLSNQSNGITDLESCVQPMAMAVITRVLANINSMNWQTDQPPPKCVDL